MPGRGPTVAINLVATGDDAVIARFNKVEKAGATIDSRFGNATRTMANFGASMAQAGAISATSLGGIAQQASMIAFSFGPAGALVGAVATAGIAIATMFAKSSEEAEEFGRTLRRIAFDGSFNAAFAKQKDIEFQLLEAQRKFAEADAKMNQRTNAIEAVKILKQRSDAEEEITRLTKERAEAVALTQKLAIEVGERQKTGLKIQQEQAAAAEREAAAQRAAAQAIKDKAANAAASAAAQAALAKASEGITLTGPSMDLGLGSLDHAPTIPVQVAPRIPIDEASAQLRLDMEALAPMIAANAEQTLGQGIVDGFTAAFQGKNPVKAFANTVLRGMGSMFIEIGKTLLGFGKIMAALQKFLTNIFTAGPAAIIAGAALIALGAAFTGITSGSGGGGSFGGGGFGGVGNITNPANVTNVTLSSGSATRAASQVQPLQQNVFNVFGPGDPMAQRAIIEAYDLGKRRGL